MWGGNGNEFNSPMGSNLFGIGWKFPLIAGKLLKGVTRN